MSGDRVAPLQPRVPIGLVGALRKLAAMHAGAGFSFVDLFAGIGGFHAALSALGGTCVYASEIDEAAARVYESNWGTPVDGDIIPATTNRMDVPDHDVLTAGFPCQPFSKSGKQLGMDEARGTLFWNICRILEERQPSVIMLENVRNLAGPRHRHEWEVIIRTLRELGYRVSESPLVLSPHRLPREMGGRPQVRERVLILGTYVGPGAADQASPTPEIAQVKVDWNLETDLPLQPESEVDEKYRLDESQVMWLEAWQDFANILRTGGEERLPGFPVWVDAFVSPHGLVIDDAVPAWKANFLTKNAALYGRHRRALDRWMRRWTVDEFPPSRRKFEWQAQDNSSVWDGLIQFRPSGIRVKKATYVPALVAITQTPVVGRRMRDLTPREVARLQGLPGWFDFGAQPESQSYKQMGNGVNVGVAYTALRQHVLANADVLRLANPRLLAAIRRADMGPDAMLESVQLLQRSTKARVKVMAG